MRYALRWGIVDNFMQRPAVAGGGGEIAVVKIFNVSWQNLIYK